MTVKPARWNTRAREKALKIFRAKAKREKVRVNERLAEYTAHVFRSDFCSDVRTLTTLLEALLCAFRGLSEAFSEATAPRFQPLS